MCLCRPMIAVSQRHRPSLDFLFLFFLFNKPLLFKAYCYSQMSLILGHAQGMRVSNPFSMNFTFCNIGKHGTVLKKKKEKEGKRKERKLN